LGNRLKLPEKTIRSFITRLKNNQMKITEIIDHSFMPEDMKLRASALVEQRIQAILVF